MRRLRSWFYDGLEGLALDIALRGENFCKDRGRPSGVVHTLVMGMRRNLLKLRMPRKMRDLRLLVADFQRCWLDLYAFLVYELEIRPRRTKLDDNMAAWEVNTAWMGCFSDQESVVMKMWEAGIPVWHIRKLNELPPDLKIGRRSLMIWEEDVETHLYPADPASPVHTGFGGEARAYLCRPVGYMALTDGAGILPNETWDQWTKRSAAEGLSTVPHGPASSLAAPSQRPPSPIVFSSRVPPDFRLLLPEIAEQISSLVVAQVGKAVSQSTTAREVRYRDRIAKRK